MKIKTILEEEDLLDRLLKFSFRFLKRCKSKKINFKNGNNRKIFNKIINGAWRMPTGISIKHWIMINTERNMYYRKYRNYISLSEQQKNILLSKDMRIA
jgi:hypothetical protein